MNMVSSYNITISVAASWLNYVGVNRSYIITSEFNLLKHKESIINLFVLTYLFRTELTVKTV